MSSSADDGQTNKQTNKQKGANKQRDDVVSTLHANCGVDGGKRSSTPLSTSVGVGVGVEGG